MDDADELKRHPYFKGTNWEDILGKQVEVPYIPEIANAKDTRNIDITFLNEVPQDSPV